MLQISRTYTFKQLCQKSDTVLRKYLERTNTTVVSENDAKLDCVLSNAETNDFAAEDLPENITFGTNDLNLVDENITTTFPCTNCSEIFDLRVDLEVHKLEHDNDKKEQSKALCEFNDKYICNVCEKEFRGKLFQFYRI